MPWVKDETGNELINLDKCDKVFITIDNQVVAQFENVRPDVVLYSGDDEQCERYLELMHSCLLGLNEAIVVKSPSLETKDE